MARSGIPEAGADCLGRVLDCKIGGGSEVEAALGELLVDGPAQDLVGAVGDDERFAVPGGWLASLAWRG